MVLTEKRREYLKKYRETHKETHKEYMKKYYKEYHEKNKEKISEQKKEYHKTEQGKKSMRISRWKKSGVICEDFNELYDYYINCRNCEECNVELIEGNKASNRRCLDHNHETGEFRNVLCHTCNTKRRYTDINYIKLTETEKKWKYKLKCFILS